MECKTVFIKIDEGSTYANEIYKHLKEMFENTDFSVGIKQRDVESMSGNTSQFYELSITKKY